MHLGFSVNDVRLKLSQVINQETYSHLDFDLLSQDVIRVRVMARNGFDSIFITYSEGGKLINLSMNMDDGEHMHVSINVMNTFHTELDSTAEATFHGIEAMLAVLGSQ